MYEKWKEQVKAACTNLKDECPDEDLGNMMDAVEGLARQVKDAYENVRSHATPSTEIRRKMDSCTAVTGDLMGLMKVCMSEVGQEDFDDKAERARLHLKRVCPLNIWVFKDQTSYLLSPLKPFFTFSRKAKHNSQE